VLRVHRDIVKKGSFEGVGLPSPLYVICDAEVCARAGWSLVDFTAACLDAGATLFQIRAKTASAAALLEMTEAVLRRAEPCRATVIVNDRADVATVAGAHGVHVGQDDLPPAAVRAVAGDDTMVGLSTHTTVQIAAAVAEPVSYIAIGPVFGSGTKDTGYAAVGLTRVREAAERAHAAAKPVVAIGGITAGNAAEVIEAGADAVAVISGLLTSGDPGRTVRAYLERTAGALRR
jgi:thiamine-phosphate pyrophosphorylase